MMMKIGASSKKVVGNSIIMYVQLVLNVLIGLISVRILLNALGQSDYGLYDLIGGVIGLFAFITSSLSQSSMRFVSVSIGEGYVEKIIEVVNSCFWLHVYISIIICLSLEIIGIFLFNGFLNIPSSRILIAQTIFHYMVFSLFFNINISPLNALVSSFEDFHIVSAISILDSILKLGVAIVVMYARQDKLLLYGILMLLITITNYAIYFIYSHYKYKNIFHISRPKLFQIKKVAGFAGWTLLDTFSSVVNRQGYAVMLNKFFGTTINSSFAVARQLEGQVFSLSSVVVNALKPQIMKSYGMGEEERMVRLSMTAGKFGYYLMSLVCIPLIVMMQELLKLWLGIIPEGAVVFAQLLIAACMMEQLTRGLVYANQSMGNIKWFSITVSFMRMLALPVSLIILLNGGKAWMAIFIFFIFESLGSISRIFVLSKISIFSVKRYFCEVVFHVLPSTIVAFAVCLYLHHVNSGFLWIVIVTVINAITFLSSVILVGLTKHEKAFIKYIFHLGTF